MKKDFNFFYEEIIAMWPESIKINIEWYGEEKYGCPEIRDISRNLMAGCRGMEHGGLYVYMHHVVFTIIHGIAPMVGRVEVKDIRKDAVKKMFEGGMMEVSSHVDSVWEEEMRGLINNYFDGTL